jgi:hypothetical protein
VGAGSASVLAANSGITGSASITITALVTTPPPVSTSEPMPGSGTTLVQDALTETSLTGLLLNFLPMVGSLGNYVTMDPTGGPGGGGAMRIDWPVSTTCQDDWAGIEHAIPGAPTEIFVQFSVRYAPGFQFDWVHTGAAPCKGTAKKLFLVWPGDGGSRFLYSIGDLKLIAESDFDAAAGTNAFQNAGNDMSSSQYGDGSWHRVTFHIKQSSTTSATDGFLYGWIDGVLRWSKPNWASGSIGGWVDFKAPSTFNQGSPANQSEWMSGLTIWRP